MIRLLYRKRKLRLREWSHLLKIGVIKLISLEKCQILMKIDVKVVSISSVNHTEIIGKIKIVKYCGVWRGGGHWGCQNPTKDNGAPSLCH